MTALIRMNTHILGQIMMKVVQLMYHFVLVIENETLIIGIMLKFYTEYFNNKLERYIYTNNLF